MKNNFKHNGQKLYKRVSCWKTVIGNSCIFPILEIIPDFAKDSGWGRVGR
jgi:hypothetical protein